MAANPARERKLAEELTQAVGVQALVGINLRIRPLQICGAKNTGCAMPRTGEINHIEIVFLDQPVQMDIDEREDGAGSSTSKQTVLDVLGWERFYKKRILLQSVHAE